MPDYIEFTNWPYKHYELKHPFDDMSLEERFYEYIQLKIKHPMLSDETLSQKAGKRAHYFLNMKKQIREEK